MNDQDSNRFSFLVLSVHQEMGESFLASIGTGPGEDMNLRTRTVKMDIMAGDPRVNPSWDDAITNADALVLLIRFLDVISLEQIKAIFRRIPLESKPMGIFLFREVGEIDFKMSCPACGQKLWVRDTDVGKRGRCPNCKKAFKLPSQSSHVRTRLSLPDAVPVLEVVRGDETSGRSAVAELIGLLTGEIVTAGEVFDPEILKQTTVRIQLSDTEAAG